MEGDAIDIAFSANSIRFAVVGINPMTGRFIFLAEGVFDGDPLKGGGLTPWEFLQTASIMNQFPIHFLFIMIAMVYGAVCCHQAKDFPKNLAS